jgi:hypothetical protein
MPDAAEPHTPLGEAVRETLAGLGVSQGGSGMHRRTPED